MRNLSAFHVYGVYGVFCDGLQLHSQQQLLPQLGRHHVHLAGGIQVVEVGGLGKHQVAPHQDEGKCLEVLLDNRVEHEVLVPQAQEDSPGLEVDNL